LTRPQPAEQRLQYACSRHDPPVFHLDDAVSHVADARIVRHQPDRAALFARKAQEQLADFAARGSVQR
jgi:hypothetical protein